VSRALAAALALVLASPASAFDIERIVRPAAIGGAPVSVEVVAGQAFVKFANGVDKQVAASAIGASIVQDHPSIGWTLIGLPPGMLVSTALTLLGNQLGVVQADGNHVYHPTTTPNDPQVSSQYGLTKINAFTAWDTETGATNDTLIAVVDGGIDTTLVDLNAKMAGVNQYFHPTTGARTGPDPLNPPVACAHGTETSSVAAAIGNNSLAIAGVAWGSKAKLISLRVFDPGCAGTTDTSLIAAVNYARTTLVPGGFGRVIINMSVGGAQSCSGAMQAALNLAVAAGVPIVISAGNDGSAVNSPANCATTTSGTGIIPVGASDSTDNIASFSSRGPELTANGVCAPGVNILTNDLSVGQGGTGGTLSISGTSFSAPHVAGVAALLLSAKPALTPAQVQSIIRSGSDGIGIATLGSSSGSGRLNAARAINLAVNGTAGSADLDTKVYAYPNPFRLGRDTSVTFNIPKGEEGATRTIRVYTMAGQLVRTVSALTWDGKNDAGKLVASGVYLFSISLGEKVLNGRLAVLR
jgi:thermitase